MANTATLDILINLNDSNSRRRLLNLRQSLQGLGGASSEIDRLNRQVRELENQLRDLRRAGVGASNALQGLGASLAGVLSLGTAAGVLVLADNMASLSSQIDLATGSAAEAEAVQKLLYSQSQLTGTAISAQTDIFASIAPLLEDYADGARRAAQVTDNLSKSISIANVQQDQAESFLLQTKQALASGIVQWEELGPALEANRDFAKRLTEQLGMTRGELKKVAGDGKLTSEQLLAAIEGMTEGLEEDFGKIPLSIGKAMTQVKNAFAGAIDSANQTADGTGRIADRISQLAVTIEQNGPAIAAMFDSLATSAELVVRSISGVAGAVATLASGATTAYSAILKLEVALNKSAAFLKEKLGNDDAAKKYRQYAAEVQTMIEAADKSAEDLAGKADKYFQSMINGSQNAKDRHKELLEQRKKELMLLEEATEAEKGKTKAAIEGEQAVQSAVTKTIESYKLVDGVWTNISDTIGQSVNKTTQAITAGAKQQAAVMEQVGGIWKQTGAELERVMAAGSTAAAGFTSELEKLSSLSQQAVQLKESIKILKDAIDTGKLSTEEYTKKFTELTVAEASLDAVKTEMKSLNDEVSQGIGLAQGLATATEKAAKEREAAEKKAAQAAKKAADEVKKAEKARVEAVENAYKNLGSAGEEYFKIQAAKLRDDVDKWIAAGAKKSESEAFFYEKIKDLAGEAYEAQEADAFKYLVNIAKGYEKTYRKVQENAEKAAKKTKEAFEKLDLKAKAELNTMGAESTLAKFLGDLKKAEEDPVTIPIEADTAEFDRKLEEVRKIQLDSRGRRPGEFGLGRGKRQIFFGGKSPDTGSIEGIKQALSIMDAMTKGIGSGGRFADQEKRDARREQLMERLVQLQEEANRQAAQAGSANGQQAVQVEVTDNRAISAKVVPASTQQQVQDQERYAARAL